MVHLIEDTHMPTCQHAHQLNPQPLQLTGYYARQASLRQLVTRFLACLHPGPVQVVSLGAGFDTLYWQLVQEGAPISRYIELDMPQVWNCGVGWWVGG